MEPQADRAPPPTTQKARPREPSDQAHGVILRVCWPHDMPIPRAGFWLASKAGRVAYRVVSAEILHHALNSPKPRLRLRATVVPIEAVSKDASLASWDLTVFRRPPENDRVRAKLQEAEAKRAALLRPDQPARIKPMKPKRDVGEMPSYRAVADGVGGVQPSSWSDPEDMGKYGRHARLVKGYRSKCVLRFMRGQAGSNVKDTHIVAADLFRQTFDIARLGRTASRDFLQEGGPSHKGPSPGPSLLALEQVTADRAYKRALRFLRPLRPELLLAVVLENKSITAWCRDQERLTGKRPNRTAEMGRLITMLDALADYYGTLVEQYLKSGYPVE